MLSCGWAADGQTGSGTTATSDRFTEVRVPHEVRAISSSADSAMVVCSNGRVYGWGNNEYHQISPSTDMQVLSPTLIDLPEPIMQVAAGGSFSLFLAESGRLYSCGYGPGTGLCSDDVITSPTLVPISKCLTYITASLDHAAGITPDGGVCRWGRGQHSKLIATSNEDIVTPLLLEGLKPIVRSVVCGFNKTCIITDSPVKSVSRLGMIEPEDEDSDEED